MSSAAFVQNSKQLYFETVVLIDWTNTRKTQEAQIPIYLIFPTIAFSLLLKPKNLATATSQ